jgi:leader peptidase (prepilin peptidase)/N-methyltransferase
LGQEIAIGAGLFVLGSLLGSFLNVVIWRLPRDESIVAPRSRCPACGALIRWYDNIPIMSFVFLRRKCRACKAPISWRYPLVEFLAGLVLVLLYLRFGLGEYLFVYGPFALALLAITFIDIDHRIIPNEISLPGILVGFGCSFLWPGFWKESLLGILLGGGLLFLLSWGYSLIRGREGMGMGDVKLLAMMGAFLGWRSLLFIALFASVQGVLAALAMWLSGVELQPPLPEEDEEESPPPPEPEAKAPPEKVGFFGAAIPFGPFLALAALEYLFFGAAFFAWLSGGRV